MAELPTDPPAAGRGKALAQSVRLPLVSGKASAAVLVACFAMTGLFVFPLAQRFPPWIDFEIVLGLWWIIWTVALAYLLYTGQRISDDHALGAPRNWLSSRARESKGEATKGSEKKPASSSSSAGWNLLDGIDGDAEGCVVAIGVVVALALALVGLWLLIEVVVPGLAFLAYFLVRGMLARVANDRHDCSGSHFRAILWGTLWATLYIVPQAVLVWFLHIIYLKAQA